MRIPGLAMLAFVCAAARAETATLAVDPARSTIAATLTILGGTDADSSPVTGELLVKIDTVATPLQITGLDFDMALTEPLDFMLTFAPGSTFSATVTGLHVVYAQPGTPIGPVPIDAGAFEFASVPTATEGFLTYTATGLACVGLMAQSLPCVDTDDLATEPVQSLDMSATIAVEPVRLVTIESTIDRTMPIDPSNPGLGTLRIAGTVVASALVPLFPGDADADCTVNFADITSVLKNFGGAGPTGDADSSGAVGFGDVTSVLQNWGLTCD